MNGKQEKCRQALRRIGQLHEGFKAKSDAYFQHERTPEETARVRQEYYDAGVEFALRVGVVLKDVGGQ
jgi:hypothetical protein